MMRPLWTAIACCGFWSSAPVQTTPLVSTISAGWGRIAHPPMARPRAQPASAQTELRTARKARDLRKKVSRRAPRERFLVCGRCVSTFTWRSDEETACDVLVPASHPPDGGRKYYERQ